MKKCIIKSITLFIVLTLFISGILCSCMDKKTTQEFNNTNDNIAKLENKNPNLEKVLIDVEEKQKEMETLLNGVKEVADLAATKAKLEEISDKLSDEKASKEDLEKISKELEKLNKTLDEKISTISKDLSALEIRVSSLEGVKELLDAKDIELDKKLDVLTNDISSAKKILDSFATKVDKDEYIKATEMLSDINGDRSIYAFEKICEIVSNDYADDVVADFNQYAEKLKFFLNRALTTEDIERYFADLEAYKNSLPSLEESFEKALDEIGANTIKLDEINKKRFENLTKIYNMILDKGTQLENESLVSDYENKSSAYEKLAETKTAYDELKALLDNFGEVSDMVYKKYDISDIQKKYSEFNIKCESANEYTGWYAEDVMSYNLDKYNRIIARDTQITDGATELQNVILTYVGEFNNRLPLYTNRDEVNGTFVLFGTITETYELDERNYKAIFAELGNENYYELLERANSYLAQFTDELLAEFEALKSDVAKYWVNNDIRYTSDKDDIVALGTTINALKEKVMNLDKFTISETASNKENLDALLKMETETEGIDTVDKFYGMLTDRMAELDGAIAEMSELKSTVDAYIAEQGKDDNFAYKKVWAQLKDYENQYNEIIGKYVIGDDTNNSDLTSETKASIDNLKDLYNVKTKALQDAYKAIVAIFEELGIEPGKTVDEAKKLIISENVDLSKRDLISSSIATLRPYRASADAIFDFEIDGEETAVSLIVTYWNASKLLQAYDETLSDAINVYNDMYDSIVSANTNVTNDVRKYKSYNDVYKFIITELAEKYLADDEVFGKTIAEKLTYLSELKGVSSGVVKIPEMKGIEAVKTFEENCNVIFDLYAGFEKAWEDLGARMDDIINKEEKDYTVHSASEFASIVTDFAKYINNYYNETVETVTDLLKDELTKYESFNACYEKATSLKDSADADYKSIAALISEFNAKNNGWNINQEVIFTATDDYNEIINSIKEFWAEYCETHNDCSCVTEYADLIENSERLLETAKNYGRTRIVEKYNEIISSGELNGDTLTAFEIIYQTQVVDVYPTDVEKAITVEEVEEIVDETIIFLEVSK